MQGAETAELRCSLHRQNESATHCEQRDHWQRVDPDLKHLLNRRVPAMTVSNQGKSSAHAPQGIPPLNIQASNVIELSESLSTGNFEKIGHHSASYRNWALPLVLKRDKMPVDSNRRSNRSCRPSNRSSVRLARAILNTSISVATPELSRRLTADKSILTTLGWGECRNARSRSPTAGEESISIAPYKYTRARSSLATTVPSLSTRLLSPSTGIDSFPGQCLKISMTDQRQPFCEIVLASVWPLPGGDNCGVVKYLRTGHAHCATMSAESGQFCPNMGIRGQLPLERDLIRSAMGETLSRIGPGSWM